MRYKMKADSKVDPTLKAGGTVYPCSKSDYGCSRDDERAYGFPCRSVSRTEDGDYPFVVVPMHDLEVLP